ncbi:MAG: ABC transporter ATP-binding protein [Bacteroidetes bacterium]|nr:ABC transporter ATP-binding protein [Bacteroidota bacterium]
MKEKNKVKFFTVLKYFWPVIKKHRVKIIVMFFASTTAIFLAGIYQPIVYKNIINTISVNSRGVPSVIWHWFYVLVGVIVGNSVAWRISDFTFLRIKTKSTKELADTSLGYTLKHSRKFFTDNFAGSLVAKHYRFINELSTIIENVIFSFWFTFVVLVGVMVVLFRENNLLAMIFLTWTFLYTVLSVFFAKRQIQYDERRAEVGSKVTGILSDIVSNVFSVKTFASTRTELNNFSSATTEEENLKMKSGYVYNKNKAIQSAMLVALEVIAMYVVVSLWLKGFVEVGMVVLVQAYIFQVDMAVWNLGNSILQFQSSMTNTKEMVEIFEAPIDIKDPENPKKCKIKEGKILFENVYFEYKDGKDVFKNFNLEIPSGQKVGLVGRSGSGKTTITNLLLRFEDVQEGSIKIDGQDIRNITQDDLRQNISYVPQEPILFHRTLKENISYGKPDASDNEIIIASRKAHADEFIKEFKDGYETLVGERGVKLSGGQRQRVAIARVMLKNAPILILDEATSSLDSISENLIQEAFDEAMKGKTTLVIAHRLSTIKKMDRIIVLDNGKIVEDGTHNDLLAKNGFYYELWQAQKDGVI